MITAKRYHDICAGHRVHGQGGKCENLHGHNYRITFTVQADRLDEVGRVLDFSVIKERLCMWLEEQWDHKFLIWNKDPWCVDLKKLDSEVVITGFNPTAENMAQFLVNVVGPEMLRGTGCTLMEVDIEETRKCSAQYKLEAPQFETRGCCTGRFSSTKPNMEEVDRDQD